VEVFEGLCDIQSNRNAVISTGLNLSQFVVADELVEETGYKGESVLDREAGIEHQLGHRACLLPSPVEVSLSPGLVHRGHRLLDTLLVVQLVRFEHRHVIHGEGQNLLTVIHRGNIGRHSCAVGPDLVVNQVPHISEIKCQGERLVVMRIVVDTLDGGGDPVGDL